jgi:hypothetical protein
MLVSSNTLKTYSSKKKHDRRENANFIYSLSSHLDTACWRCFCSYLVHTTIQNACDEANVLCICIMHCFALYTFPTGSAMQKYRRENVEMDSAQPGMHLLLSASEDRDPPRVGERKREIDGRYIPALENADAKPVKEFVVWLSVVKQGSQGRHACTTRMRRRRVRRRGGG